jgi:hypothetical protein
MTLVVAGISALAAIFAAVVAGVFAWKTRRADADAQRARDLESRISERKYAVYEPFINLFADVLSRRKSPTQEVLLKKLQDFATWISIYGSADAVKAFHDFAQAAYNDAPAPILLRLYGDFMVAARKDMGYDDAGVYREHVLGMRITNIYTYPDVIDQSFEEVCDRLDWQPPWLSSDVTPRQSG